MKETRYFVTLLPEPFLAPCTRTTIPSPTMSPELPGDRLANLVSPDTQRLAARMAQDAFAALFRLTADGDGQRVNTALADLEARGRNWCAAGDSADATALRAAMLISGLDQWGLAYSQAFGLTAIPALSALLGSLRHSLEPAVEVRFQTFFQQLENAEGDAIDFKIELRRNIHLALWHAMSACDEAADAQRIAECLASLMLALVGRMPALGSRLLADALAGIQISLLADNPAPGPLAQEKTQQLFEALRQHLPAEQYREILAYSGQAVMAWDQARRAAN